MPQSSSVDFIDYYSSFLILMDLTHKLCIYFSEVVDKNSSNNPKTFPGSDFPEVSIIPWPMTDLEMWPPGDSPIKSPELRDWNFHGMKGEKPSPQ